MSKQYYVVEITGEKRLIPASWVSSNEKGLSIWEPNCYGGGTSIYFDKYDIYDVEFLMQLDHAVTPPSNDFLNDDEFEEYEAFRYKLNFVDALYKVKNEDKYIVTYDHGPIADGCQHRILVDILSTNEVNELIKLIKINYEVA